jgi:TatD DNase family protein
LATVRQWLDQRSFLAIGEIGIDLYWDKTFLAQQREAFLQQVEWALEFDLPIVIHARESLDILIELVGGVGDSRLRGVFHCFTGTTSQAEAIMKLGFYLGIGGVATYKNSGLSETLASVPLEAVVLETDAPYLAPVPRRGKRNESAYLRHVAEHLAGIYAMPLDELAEVTSRNARKLFQLN